MVRADKRSPDVASSVGKWRQVHIAVLLEGRSEYDRGVLRGVRRFVDQRPGWTLQFLSDRQRLLRTLTDTSVAGVLLESWQVESDVLRSLRQRGVPVVNLCEAPKDLRLAGVGLDNDRIGAMAADYLRGIQPRSFAFVGPQGVVSSAHRSAAFRRTLTAAGHMSAQFVIDRTVLTLRPAVLLEKMGQWLQGLPKPAAVLAANDECALEVLNACAQAKLSVPDEITVLGVDNDELLCELAQPSLSSIAVPAEQIGFEAARLLEALIDGRQTDTVVHLIPPLGVVARRSTECLRADEPVTAAALRFIQEHLDQSFNVEDIARAGGVCRRLLERRFLRTIGRSPLQEIHRQRLQRAQALLAGSNLPIHRIAVATGFASSPHFSDTFKRETGLSPRQYRQQAG